MQGHLQRCLLHATASTCAAHRCQARKQHIDTWVFWPPTALRGARESAYSSKPLHHRYMAARHTCTASDPTHPEPPTHYSITSLCNCQQIGAGTYVAGCTFEAGQLATACHCEKLISCQARQRKTPIAGRCLQCRAGAECSRVACTTQRAQA